MSALIKYEESLREHPLRGQGLHQHIMRVACLGTIAEIPPNVMEKDMTQHFQGIRPKEAFEAIVKATGMSFDSGNYTPHAVTQSKPNSKLTLDHFIKDQPTDTIELVAMSPNDVSNGDIARSMLETLYDPDEYLFIGDTYSTKVKKVSEWLAEGNIDQPFIIPNPLTGMVGKTQSGKDSFRCDATVADLRFAVCEMDEVPLEKQVAFWLECIAIGIPVALVVYSGKKSLHAWVKVDCGLDVDKWNSLVRDWWFKDFGIRYGLDPACQNRARLSRMAEHHREGANLQSLLYLNGAI